MSEINQIVESLKEASDEVRELEHPGKDGAGFLLVFMGWLMMCGVTIVVQASVPLIIVVAGGIFMAYLGLGYLGQRNDARRQWREALDGWSHALEAMKELKEQRDNMAEQVVRMTASPGTRPMNEVRLIQDRPGMHDA